MTHEEFTGVTFNDLDPSRTRISRSSKFSVVNSTEIALNVLHRAHIFTGTWLWSSGIWHCKSVCLSSVCMSLMFVTLLRELKLTAVFLHCCVP